MIATRDAYGKALVKLGEVNPNIVVLDADLAGSTKTINFKKEFPDRFFNMGIAEGNEVPVETLYAMLFSMYCFELDNRCTCFAFATEEEIVFGRNSDFLVSLEKLYMNCLYKLNGCHGFNGNTTAFVQIEDGVNERGLAVGLTFVYPHIRKPGLNAGMLVRYLLENCQNTDEAVKELHRLPIASAQTITLADKTGNIAVVECNPEKVILIKPENGENFVATANNFNSEEMRIFRNPAIDDWRSDDRYNTVYNALISEKNNYSVEFAKSLLAGKYGFICQYDRKSGADTVWSVVYDLKRDRIYRVEGNPSRKRFLEDERL